MAELVDAARRQRAGRKPVRVRIPPPAPWPLTLGAAEPILVNVLPTCGVVPPRLKGRGIPRPFLSCGSVHNCGVMRKALTQRFPYGVLAPGRGKICTGSTEKDVEKSHDGGGGFFCSAGPGEEMVSVGNCSEPLRMLRRVENLVAFRDGNDGVRRPVYH